MKKLLTILILITLSACSTPPFGAGEKIPEDLKLKTTNDKILDSKDIPTKDCTKTGETITATGTIDVLSCTTKIVKKYQYIDTKVSGEYLFEGRNISNAVVRSRDGDKTTVEFFASDKFFKDGNGDVYSVAEAATTPDLFVTRYSLYAIDIGPTTQIHKLIY